MLPETRYARQGGLHLAYQVLGEGPPDLLLLDQWFSHMEAQWDVPPVAEFRERLASFGRLIMYDKRGSGLSDPIPTSDLPTIEEWMDDVPIVLDAAGSDRAVVIANLGGGLGAPHLRSSAPGACREPRPRRLLRALHPSARLPTRGGAGGSRPDARGGG
jgi:pimeloyl-ACP methyl ester carboxylesterase